MSRSALIGADLVLPDGVVQGAALLLDGAWIAGVVAGDAVPDGFAAVPLEGGTLWPGFIDTQVNGGGGVLFNDDPSVDAIAAIAAAHLRHGTTALLPTLISDTRETVARAIAAVEAAMAAGVPGIIGIHLEGPFLNPLRKGVHDDSHFGALDIEAIDLLSSLRGGVTLVTLAPERAPPGAIAEMVRRGVIVAAGHTDATYEQMQAAMDEGLTGLTHLFNAMSPMQSRAPGVVGAGLADRRLTAGVIADGAHVHPGALCVAFAAMGPGRLMLVTDAMPTVGGPSDRFTLGGRQVMARGQTCWTADGVLAGSNLTMASAVANVMRLTGASSPDAARMAGATPAAFLGLSADRGSLAAGQIADCVHISADGDVRGV